MVNLSMWKMTMMKMTTMKMTAVGASFYSMSDQEWVQE